MYSEVTLFIDYIIHDTLYFHNYTWFCRWSYGVCMWEIFSYGESAKVLGSWSGSGFRNLILTRKAFRPRGYYSRHPEQKTKYTVIN